MFETQPDKAYALRPKSIVASALLLILVTAGYWSEALARVAWYRFRLAPLALVLNPKNPKLLFEIGNHYFNGGAYDLRRARDFYLKASRAEPKYPRINFQMARIYFLDGNYGQARQLIDTEIFLYPDFTRSYYVRGLINAYSENLAEAEQDFRLFLESNPTSWAAYNDLAFVYWKIGDYQRMKDTAEQGLVLHSQNPWLLSTNMNALLNLGAYDKALKNGLEAEEALAKLTEDDWRIAYPGHPKEKAALGINQMKAVLYFNQGLIYEKLKRLELAIRSFEKFMELGGTDESLDRSVMEAKIASLKNRP